MQNPVATTEIDLVKKFVNVLLFYAGQKGERLYIPFTAFSFYNKHHGDTDNIEQELNILIGKVNALKSGCITNTKFEFDASGNSDFLQDIALSADLDVAKLQEIIAQFEGSLKTPLMPKGFPNFNTSTSSIIWDNKKLEIPPSSNQYFICQKVFGVPFGLKIKESEILDSIDWAKEGKSSRTVYDAVDAVNDKILETYGVKKLLICKNNYVWVDEEKLPST